MKRNLSQRTEADAVSGTAQRLPVLRPSVTAAPRLHLQAPKLLRSKWTAAVPVGKEKHFIVTALLAPEPPGLCIDAITMQAVLTGRSFTMRWRELHDAGRWRQGWL